MKQDWNTQYISPQNLIQVSRGKDKVAIKYLKQFLELIPSRTTLLRQSLAKKDRESVRKILHQISPQLQFFGIPDVVPQAREIINEYQTMDWDDLEDNTESIIGILHAATKEVAVVLKTCF